MYQGQRRKTRRRAWMETRRNTFSKFMGKWVEVVLPVRWECWSWFSCWMMVLSVSPLPYISWGVPLLLLGSRILHCNAVSAFQWHPFPGHVLLLGLVWFEPIHGNYLAPIFRHLGFCSYPRSTVVYFTWAPHHRSKIVLCVDSRACNKLWSTLFVLAYKIASPLLS